jgi:hypothetical protein
MKSVIDQVFDLVVWGQTARMVRDQVSDQVQVQVSTVTWDQVNDQVVRQVQDQISPGDLVAVDEISLQVGLGAPE